MSNTETNVPAQASDEPMRAAFENCAQNRSRLAFKRGGTVFAENVPEAEYFDQGVQASWVFWQEAYRAGIAEGRAYQRRVEAKKEARRATKGAKP
jgi:hypothetical protein